MERLAHPIPRHEERMPLCINSSYCGDTHIHKTISTSRIMGHVPAHFLNMLFILSRNLVIGLGLNEQGCPTKERPHQLP